jgi:acyl carrier protein
MLALIREALIHAAPDKAARFDRLEWSSSLSNLGVDSIGLLDASAYIEDRLSAHFPDDKLARVELISDFGALMQQHLKTNGHQDQRRPTP